MKNFSLLACLGGVTFLFGLKEAAVAGGSDNFANATVITDVSAPITGSNVESTGEFGEPNHNNVSEPINSVWWQWTAPFDGQLVITTEGSSFDTTLAVYTGLSLTSLNEVVSNDDIVSGVQRASKVSLSVASGEVYWIAVDGWWNETGNISLVFSLQPYSVPLNDNFASATLVTKKSPFLIGHNGGATPQPNEPSHGGALGPFKSVWYQWDADTSGSVTISTLGSDFDTTLAVYTGTSLSSLILVASNNDFWGTQSQVTFNASAGTSYRIAVDGFSSAMGNLTLGFAFPAQQVTSLPLGALVNKNGTNVTGVTFRVWAPNATAVSVRGQFNSWGETVMTKDAITDYWAVTNSAARPGQEYKYFLKWAGNTNGSWKQDPRAVEVRNGNSVIYDQEAFAWGSVTNPVIPTGQQVMYQMHVGTFNDPDPQDGRPGTFYDAVRRLDYLQRLGVNVVVLMPVHEFGGDFSWGYNPGSVHAIESAYGGPDGFKSFVKAAHERGIAVHVDVVHNHYNSSSEGLWEFDGPSNIYFYSGERASTDWGPRPDFDKPEVQRFIQDHTKMLLEKFRIDGFRWDSPENITGYRFLGTDRVLPGGKKIMTEINRMIRTEFQDVSSIAETANLLIIRTLPTTDPLGVFEASDSFHGHWNYGFFYGVIEQITSAQPNLFSISNNLLSGPERPGYRVLFSDNHDKAGGQHNREKGYPNSRLASRIDSNNPTSWIARKKNILGGLLPLTAPGVPMLFMGQEFQAAGIFADTNPLSWVRAGQQHRIFRAHRDLLNLRASFPALQNTNTNSTVSIIDSASGVCSYHRRGASASEDVFVVLNLSGGAKTNLSLSFPASGDWYLRFNSDWNVYSLDFGNVGPSSNQVAVDSGLYGSITVAPWSGLIFARTPADSSITIDDADNDGMPDGWENLYGVFSPQGDADGDGITNFREYQLEFDPSVTNATTVAGAFNQWDPAGAAMKPTSTLDQLHYLYVTEEALTNQPIKYLLSGEWHGASTNAGIAATPGTNNIFYDAPNQGYVYFTFNTDTKAYTIATFSPTNRVDEDSDGMDDRWETWHGLMNPSADPDSDGFTNLQEFQRGSSPNAWNRPQLALAGGFNNWNAGANPLTYSWHNQWYLEFPFRNGSTGLFKFTDGTWANDWGDNATPDGVVDLRGADINISFNQGTGIYRFQFNEAFSTYQLLPFDATDANFDGIQDAWIGYYGLIGSSASASADPDGDGASNLAEFRRLSSPIVVDRMSVVGSRSPLAWAPDDMPLRMSWSDARQRWEWTGDFSAGSLAFKFASGPGWDGFEYGTGAGVAANTASTAGSSDLSTNLVAGRYRFAFSETNGGYTVQSFPVSTEWREVHGLPSVGAWTNDTDKDGVVDLLEYALGGNPNNQTDGKTLQTMANTNSGGTNRLVLQWLQRTDGGSSLAITPEFATDLAGTWSPLVSSNAANTAGVPPQHVRKEVSTPQDGSKKFLRLKVSGP